MKKSNLKEIYTFINQTTEKEVDFESVDLENHKIKPIILGKKKQSSMTTKQFQEYVIQFISKQESFNQYVIEFIQEQKLVNQRQEDFNKKQEKFNQANKTQGHQNIDRITDNRRYLRVIIV